VVVCSAKSGDSDRARAQELGADEYVTKPFEPDDLVLVIRNVLRDDSWRYRLTVAEERFAAALGWMRFATGHFPRREDIESPLASLGFDVRVEPLWGATPFNSYLIVARRTPDA